MKMNNKVLLLVLGCMIGACSPKISDVKSPETTEPVSYTHLDVYKRQLLMMTNGF